MRKKIIVLEILALIIMIITGTTEESIRIVNYKTYKEGNTTNFSLNKILSDNKLQEEIPHMFNYASNGMYISGVSEEGEPQYSTDESQKTTGLYSMEDEDGTSYYYRGNVDNNNVQFGEYTDDYYVYYDGYSLYYQSEASCEEATGYSNNCTQVKLASAGDKMYWKIIRVNGDGSLRLIYNGTSITHPSGDKDISMSNSVGISQYNLYNDNPKYVGYTYDRDTNETDSFIKREVDTWYENALGNTIYDSKVLNGRFCSDSSGYREETMMGGSVFASFDRLGSTYGKLMGLEMQENVTPTLKCPTTSESYGGRYRLKAGLITADELVLAGESPEVYSDDYLGTSKKTRALLLLNNLWTMTPFNFNSMWSGGYFLSDIIVSDNVFVRPVINISTENAKLIGDGTENNPYILEEVENNHYKGKITIAEGSSVDDNMAFAEEIELSNDIIWTSNDSSIAILENGKILGLKEGVTTITGINKDGTTYEIEVTVINNPTTMSSIYITIGILLILMLGTTIYLYYKKKFKNL